MPGGSSGGSAAAVAACIAPASLPAPTPAARFASRRRFPASRAQADVRPRVALRPDRLCLEPRPGRRARAFGRRRGAAARSDRRATTRATRPASTAPVPDYPADLTSRHGPARRYCPRVLRRRPRRGGRDGHARGDRVTAQDRRLIKDVSLPSLALRPYYIVAPAECSSNLARYDGVRYGHRCRSPRTYSMSTRARATRASAPRSSGGSCWAPTCFRPATTTRITSRR